MKNEVRISPENSDIIDALLNNIQKGCDARLLTYDDLEKSARIAESLLEKILRKQHRQNVYAHITPEYDAFSPYYRGTPEHTHCLIRRGEKLWYVSNIEREKANRAGSCRVHIDRISLEPKHYKILEFITSDLQSNIVVKAG